MYKNIRDIILVVALLVLAAPLSAVNAQNANDLRNQINELNHEIDDSNEHIHELSVKESSLEEYIANLNSEIAGLQQKINETSTKISEVKEEIKQAEKELARQQEIMNESIRTLYKQGNVSTVELIAASENFSDFINQQEYIERVKINVAEAAEKVKALKEKLEKEEKELSDLLARQNGQKEIVESKRQERQRALNQTRNERASFAAYVEDLEQRKANAEQELLEWIRRNQANNTFVSQGRVSAGEIIGYTGSTGSSFAPHLHLGVVSPSGNYVDPIQSEAQKTMKFGFQWPYVEGYGISRGYRCTSVWAAAQRSWCPYVTSTSPGGYAVSGRFFHEGVDFASPNNSKVRAIGSGDIIYRGVWGGAGYTVMIQHDNGYISRYFHLQPF